MIPMPILIALVGAFNLLWIVVYIVAIPKGFRDQAYPIPVVALAVNTSWDLYGTVIRPSPNGQWIFNIMFLIADLIIWYQVFRFWKSDSGGMNRNQFYFFAVLSMVMSLGLYLALTVELNDYDGVRMAFVDNFINSALFVAMFFRRPDLRGQSLTVGWLKLIGTGCASIAFTFNRFPGTENSVLIPALCLSILTLDALYVGLVYQRQRQSVA